MEYAELHCHNYYSFLNGMSSPAELAERAIGLGLKGLALTDDDGFYGIIPFAKKCQEVELPFVIGSLITTELDDKIVLLCEHITGYHHLSQLITHARHGQPKGEARATIKHISELSDGLICLIGGKEGKFSTLLQNKQVEAARARIEAYRQIFDDKHLFIHIYSILPRLIRSPMPYFLAGFSTKKKPLFLTSISTLLPQEMPL